MPFDKNEMHTKLCIAKLKDLTFADRVRFYMTLACNNISESEVRKIKSQIFDDAYLLSNNRTYFPICTVAERETLEAAYLKVYLCISHFNMSREYAAYSVDRKRKTA